VTEVIAAIVAAVIAAGSTFAIIRAFARLRRKDAESEAQRILAQANQDAANQLKAAELEIKEKAIQQKAETERELSKLRDVLRERERALDKREEMLTQQADALQKQERIVESTQRRLTEKLENSTRQNEDLGKVLEMHRQTLHKISGLSRDEATQRLLGALNDELAQETGQIILRHERQVAERCEALSREMLLTALHRYAAAHTAESTTSTVDIPSDDMKGRIIGREGRNIRAFEKRTGVDVIIDDTPGVVIVSGFDPVRREIARQSLEKLIVDGRIHPSRIEEIVGDTEKEIEKFIRRGQAKAGPPTQIRPFGITDRPAWVNPRHRHPARLAKKNACRLLTRRFEQLPSAVKLAGNQWAISVNRDSRTTVTLISPGYVSRSSNALAMSRQIRAARTSSASLALTSTRSSRPA